MIDNKENRPGRKERLLKKLFLRSVWRKITSMLLSVVVFFTTYMMILPAISIDVDTAYEEPGMETAEVVSPEDRGLTREEALQTEYSNDLTGSADALPISASEEEDIVVADESVEEDIVFEDSFDLSESWSEDDYGSDTVTEVLPEESEGESGAGEFFDDSLPEETESELSEEIIPDELQEEADTELSEEISSDMPELPEEFVEEELSEESEGEPTEEADLVLDDPESEEEPDSVLKLEAEGPDYHVTVTSSENAKIPAGAILQVTEILSDEYAYERYMNEASDALTEEDSTKTAETARFFDITILKDGEEIQPQEPVEVKMELADKLAEKATEEVKAVHFAHMDDVESEETIEVPVVLDAQMVEAEGEGSAVGFEASTFSVYGIVVTGTITTHFIASDGNLYDVTVHYNDAAQIPEGSTLLVTEINKDTSAYDNAYRLLFDDEPYEDAPMLAVDISVISPEGIEIEPKSAVKVELTMKALPEGITSEELRETIEISHMKEVPGGIVVEKVASGSDISVNETVDALFEVESFSQFNITWARNGNTRATIRVHYVDEDGNDLTGQQSNVVSTNTNNSQTYYFADYATRAIDGANYKEARLGTLAGNVVTRVTFSRESGWFTTYNYTRFYNGNTLVSEHTDTTYDVYLIYNNLLPGLTISKTSSGATTPETAMFTVSSTDGEYSRTFTYADMTDGKIKLTDAPVGKTYTVTESGGERNGYILSTTYGNNVTLTENRPSGTLTVNNTYANDPNVVKVYVYVAAYDEEGNQFKNNPEFLELLGISGDTVDGNGYFPVGEIYIDKSFFNGKTTNKWTALINSSDDWEHVLAALGELDTSTLIYDLNVDYSENRGNNVGEYMDQAIGDVNKGAGSQCTALFGWSGHSYGFADQSVEYHLDLRFQTNKVTFITGNNGIRTGASKDGTTVDVRAYIQGSPIQQPRNLVIPAGYRLVGYYNDPDFTTPWNKIGTPIIQDEIAYIKITPQDNVILHYKPVPAAGGTVSIDAEGVNPETGEPTGSTATANPGYSFAGWYADEECTQRLSEEATFVPTKSSGERWVDGTTYYAKFVENTVTLTFKAEDHVDHLEFDSVPDNIVSYEFSEDRKTLTVVVDALTGSPVTVKGVAETGYAIKEWTIDGRTGALTASGELTTNKTDDPAAPAGLWTDRTYHVWAEVLKTITVTKEVNIIGTLHDDEVDVTVYFALKDMSKDPAPWVYNSDGTIYTTSVQIVDGIPLGTAVFADLPAGTYEVWEVADENAGSFGPGSEVSEGIVVSRIQTWISDTDTGNDVILSDNDPHGSIKVINTFNHANEAMTFRANKKWFTVKNSYTDANAEANVDVPEGAWVDFTLFRINADGSEEAVETIRLDGSPNAIGEESAWSAAFRDLANVDDDGHPVSYYVKETAVSDLSAYDYYTTFNDTTYTNGGSISNVAAYGDVNVTKEIELPAGISEAEKNAFIDALQITVVGPSEVEESRRLTRVLDRDDFAVTESTKNVTYGSTTQSVKVLTLTASADDLPAGTYTVTESGYNAGTLAYRWDSAHSWIKADKLPSDQSSLVNKEQYGKVSIDVPVGINVTDENFTTNVNLLNSYVVQDIKVTKVWDDLGMENADHPSVSMTLSRTDGSGNTTTVSSQIIGANQTGDNLTLTWKNQPQACTYSVTEAPIRGYRMRSVTGNATDGFIVTNERAAAIKVVKVDQLGQPLADAQFSGDLIDGTITTEITGAEGAEEAVIINNSAVPAGTYIINEDAAPSGYSGLAGSLKIIVTKDADSGEFKVSAMIGDTEMKYPDISRSLVTGEWTIKITNQAGYELPSTGGYGTWFHYIKGAMLMALAGTGLLMKKRRIMNKM